MTAPAPHPPARFNPSGFFRARKPAFLRGIRFSHPPALPITPAWPRTLAFKVLRQNKQPLAVGESGYFDIGRAVSTLADMAIKKQGVSGLCFCTAEKLAMVLGVSAPTPINWFKTGKLPGVRIGHLVRFPIAEVAALLGIKPELLQ